MLEMFVILMRVENSRECSNSTEINECDGILSQFALGKLDNLTIVVGVTFFLCLHYIWHSIHSGRYYYDFNVHYRKDVKHAPLHNDNNNNINKKMFYD